MPQIQSFTARLLKPNRMWREGGEYKRSSVFVSESDSQITLITTRLWGILLSDWPIMEFCNGYLHNGWLSQPTESLKSTLLKIKEPQKNKNNFFGSLKNLWVKVFLNNYLLFIHYEVFWTNFGANMDKLNHWVKLLNTCLIQQLHLCPYLTQSWVETTQHFAVWRTF